MGNTRPVQILIAEDSLTSRAILSGVLKKAGHEVIETVDGDGAWGVMQQANAPRLAILDWMMPGMDGVEVVRRVRTMPATNPPYLIMLTSKGDKDDIVAGLNAGADDYLTKPFNPSELLARVNVGCRVLEMQSALTAKVEELSLAMEQIKTLRGIVPICSGCKQIRDDQGYWSQLEVYMRDHSEAQFSHSICPACIEKLYPKAELDRLAEEHAAASPAGEAGDPVR